MIIPQQTDLGRRVVCRPPGAGRRYGVISAIYTRRLFVRFNQQHYSREVDPAYLAFVKPPAEALPRSDECSGRENWAGLAMRRREFITLVGGAAVA